VLIRNLWQLKIVYFLNWCLRCALPLNYRILSSIVHTFYIENDAEIFPAYYIWKVAEKGFKIAFMMNKPAMINSFEIII
jgi:hypothetical protein